jgi:hypothetical protein
MFPTGRQKTYIVAFGSTKYKSAALVFFRVFLWKNKVNKHTLLACRKKVCYVFLLEPLRADKVEWCFTSELSKGTDVCWKKEPYLYQI